MSVMRTYFTEKNKRDYIILVLCPIITFYLFDLYTHNPFTGMEGKTQLLNIIFYEILNLFFIGIFKYVRVALMLQSTFFMIFGLVNYYVVDFRSAPIRPWDFFSIRTAVSVADNYNYGLEWDTLLILAGFLLLLWMESRLKVKAPVGIRNRFLCIVLPFLLLCGFTAMVQNDGFVSRFGLYDKFFTPTVVNKRDGNAVAFLMAMEYTDIDKPDGYSEESVKQMLEQSKENSEGLAAALANPNSVNRPNIIVIMDEAFSDLAVLGDINTNQDYMPFIHSLQKGAENTVTGTLHVSVLGGNTANSEFEFLTGSTMAFLPQGSVPYQQYVQNKMPSMASYLKELGYQTIALHPYHASGWDRKRVYPLLGFDEFLSIRDFSSAKKIRNYVSDEACFDKMIEIYENKEEGQPLFLFNVTMQNHSGYTEAFDNFTPEITVEGITAKALPMYLSLMRETDRALEELISYFEQEDEETMIVFFGDHQPTAYVSNPILLGNGIAPESLTEEENLKRYQVPYVIWSNFDIEEQSNQETSVNYLMMDVLEKCGLPLPAYQNCMKRVREEYPIISAMQIRDKHGKYWESQDCGEVLKEYQRLQYYYLFE